jgi:hypothetical protein
MGTDPLPREEGLVRSAEVWLGTSEPVSTESWTLTAITALLGRPRHRNGAEANGAQGSEGPAGCR